MDLINNSNSSGYQTLSFQKSVRQNSKIENEGETG